MRISAYTSGSCDCFRVPGCAIVGVCLLFGDFCCAYHCRVLSCYRLRGFIGWAGCAGWSVGHWPTASLYRLSVHRASSSISHNPASGSRRAMSYGHRISSVIRDHVTSFRRAMSAMVSRSRLVIGPVSWFRAAYPASGRRGLGWERTSGTATTPPLYHTAGMPRKPTGVYWWERHGCAKSGNAN